MSTPDTQEKSYFLTHIHKENSESLQGPEAHADFAVESARIGLVNFMKELNKRLPEARYRDDAAIQQYAAVAVTIEAMRQCRNIAPKAYEGIIYDVSGATKELEKRRDAELRAAKWQKWAMFGWQLAASAAAILLIIALA